MDRHRVSAVGVRRIEGAQVESGLGAAAIEVMQSDRLARRADARAVDPDKLCASTHVTQRRAGNLRLTRIKEMVANGAPRIGVLACFEAT